MARNRAMAYSMAEIVDMVLSVPDPNCSRTTIRLLMDTRNPEHRRRIMQAVKQKNTGPEIAVRRLLHAMGYRFRLHIRELPGRPDIVLPRRRAAIFVHGCFWHTHGCPKGRPPKSNLKYWLPKLEQNSRRDQAKSRQLRSLGWRVIVIWQCELADLDAVAVRLQEVLEAREPDITSSGMFP